MAHPPRTKLVVPNLGRNWLLFNTPDSELREPRKWRCTHTAVEYKSACGVIYIVFDAQPQEMELFMRCVGWDKLHGSRGSSISISSSSVSSSSASSSDISSSSGSSAISVSDDDDPDDF